MIPAGQALSEKHVNALKMWGVVSLDIEGAEEVQVVATASPEAIESARVALQPLYRHTDLSHPFVRKVFEHVVQSRAQELASAPPDANPQPPEVNPAPVGATQ